MVEIPKYVVYDCETTITEGKASAHVPENTVVLDGIIGGTNAKRWNPLRTDLHIATDTVLVGHNIAFDLQYQLKMGCDPWLFIRNRNTLWDTDVAEYVLSGQTSKMNSLNDLALRYGGTVKDSAVSDAFKAGKGADTIEKETLRAYFDGDLKNTELVFKAQYEKAEQEGQLELIKWMGMARLFTAIMQYNGIRVDVASALSLRSKLEIEHRDVCGKLAAGYRNAVLEALPTIPNLVSVKEDNDVTDNKVSALLFGGTVPVTVVVDTGAVVKTGSKKGKAKLKNLEILVDLPMQLAPLSAKLSSSKSYSRIHPLDDDILELVQGGGPAATRDVARLVRTKRRMEKLIGTYIDGVLKNTYPDSCVHPDFNSTLTVTGRLSCSNPNMQNQDPETKTLFVPHEEHEFLLELDFKQLEVCGLAILSNDPQLIADLHDGTDLHYETGRVVFGWTDPSRMDEETRTKVKRVNFGLIYGGTAAGLSKQVGLSKELVQRLINAFYTRYPRVKEWQNENIEAVKAGRVYESGKHGLTEKRYPAGESVLKTFTGRKYVFKEYDAPDWLAAKGELTGFSPTEIKNYPVQGFSTGDVVPIVLALSGVVLCTNTTVLERHAIPVNTVHDSAMWSVETGKAASIIYAAYRDTIIPLAESVIAGWLGVDKLPVKLKVDAKMGPNWGSMKKVTF